MNELFFELIQVAIGRRMHLSRTPSSEEWEQLFLMAERQTVLGICFKAVKEMADSVASIYEVACHGCQDTATERGDEQKVCRGI